MSTKSLLELSTSPKPWFCTVMLPSCSVSAATVPATCRQSTHVSCQDIQLWLAQAQTGVLFLL